MPCPKAAEQAGILRRHMKMIEPAGPSFFWAQVWRLVGEIPEVEAFSMGKSSTINAGFSRVILVMFDCQRQNDGNVWQCIQHHILLDVNPGLRSSPF